MIINKKRILILTKYKSNCNYLSFIILLTNNIPKQIPIESINISFISPDLPTINN